MSRIQGTLLKKNAPLAQFWITLDQVKKGKIAHTVIDLEDTINLIEKNNGLPWTSQCTKQFLSKVALNSQVVRQYLKGPDNFGKNADILD